jgi:hypothetical protein
MKNVVFFDVTMCGSSKNRRFGVTYRRVLRLLDNAKIVLSSNIITKLTEVIRSSGTWVLIRVIWYHISQDVILRDIDYTDILMVFLRPLSLILTKYSDQCKI